MLEEEKHITLQFDVDQQGLVIHRFGCHYLEKWHGHKDGGNEIDSGPIWH